MNQQVDRREVLKRTVFAGAGLCLGLSPRRSIAAAAGEKLNLAFIGLGGQGKSNLDPLSSQNVVALCDVDDKRAGDAFDRFPKARKFYDYRQMFDEMEKSIDGVVISTPDHSHFHPTMMAIRRGKHVYLEKPMAHSLAEVRAITRFAAEKKVATQLGCQRHAHDNMHRVVELIQGGAIGPVAECHAWVDGDRGMPKYPPENPPVPAHLKWDLWLGPAAERPFSPSYAPYGWRFWWDFGTGETGNWGCHILDIPFWALGLKYPTRVEASGPSVHPQTTPKSMTTRFQFPGAGGRPAVTLHWYHVKDGPPILKEKGLSHPGSGVLFVGSEGMLLCDFGKRWLLPESKFAGFTPPARSIPNSPGFHKEWINACKGGEPATCHFGYTGPLAETVLLGNVAYRAGGGFEWNAENLQARNRPEADALIRPAYRKGWEI